MRSNRNMILGLIIGLIAGGIGGFWLAVIAIGSSMDNTKDD